MWFHYTVGAYHDIFRWLSIGLSTTSSLGHPHRAGRLLTLATDAPGGIRPVASRSSRTLCLTDRPAGSRTLTSAHAAITMALFPMEPCRHRRLQILKHRSPLLCASRDHCPDPFAPAVSLSLLVPRDQTIDHHEPDRWLRQVVCRLHSRGRDEPEITLPMLLEPLR